MLCELIFAVVSLTRLAGAHTPHDTVSSMTVAGDTIYITSRGIPLRSNDGGQSWRQVLPRNRFANVVTSSTYATDDTAFIHVENNADERIMLKTTNGGARWFETVDVCTNDLGTTDHTLPQKEWLVSAGGVSITVSSGMSGYRLLRSVGAGDFVEVTGEMPFTLTSCPKLATDGTKMYLAIASGSVFESLDYGLTWSFVMAEPGGVRQIVPFQDGFFLVSEEDRLFFYQCTSCFGSNVCHHNEIVVALPDASNVPASGPSPIMTVSTHTWQGSTSLYIVRANSLAFFVARDFQLDFSRCVSWDSRGPVSTGEYLTISGLPNSIKAERFEEETFDFVKGIDGTPRVYVGSYTGLWVSDNGGESFIHMDTIGKAITGISVAVAGPGSMAVGYCTYTGGCYIAHVDVATSTSQVTRLPPGQENEDDVESYSLILLSPTYEQDGLAFRFAQYARQYRNVDLNTRSQDDFATSVAIDFPTTPSSSDGIPDVQDLAFPNDGMIFACGYDMGVSVSTDRGYTFTLLWDGDGVNNACLEMALSPSYDSDGIMAMLVDTTPDENDARFGNNFIYLSQDRGQNWSPLGSNSGSWNSLVLIAGSMNVPNIVVVEEDGDVSMRPASNGGPDFRQLERVTQSRYPLGISKDGLAASPDGTEVAFGFFELGAIKYGVINETSYTLDDRYFSRPNPWDEGAQFQDLDPIFFAYGHITYRDFRKFSETIQYSPSYASDRIVFTGSFYSLYMSVNRGRTFTEVATIPHGTGFV